MSFASLRSRRFNNPLANPAVTGAIVGARKPEQVNDMGKAAAIGLTPAEARELEMAVDLAA